MYDVIIIGGGPAGMSAAIYTSRRALKTLVISRDLGGQITKTNDIENYPGFGLISGVELAKKFYDQALKFGTEFLFDEVKEIKKEDGHFAIKTIHKNLETKSIILAFGKKPRELNVPGEEKFKGKGVSYCAICDAPFYKKKVVVIAGDGNSALHAAITAAEVASHVYLIAKHDKFIGEEILIDKVKSYKNVKIFMATKIAEICGDKKVDSIRLESGEEIKTDGIIIEIGHEIDRTLIKDLVKLDEKNQVIIDNMQNTSVPGIFAAGDLTNTPYNQIVISAGEGAKASLSVFNYLQSLKQK